MAQVTLELFRANLNPNPSQPTPAYTGRGFCRLGSQVGLYSRFVLGLQIGLANASVCTLQRLQLQFSLFMQTAESSAWHRYWNLYRFYPRVQRVGVWVEYSRPTPNPYPCQPLSVPADGKPRVRQPADTMRLYATECCICSIHCTFRQWLVSFMQCSSIWCWGSGDRQLRNKCASPR